jgi:hypothetical protein
MHATINPKADNRTQWRGNGGVTMSRVDKLVLHISDPVAGLPTLTSSQTLTFNPWLPRSQRWRQHHPISGSASTLRWHLQDQPGLLPKSRSSRIVTQAGRTASPGSPTSLRMPVDEHDRVACAGSFPPTLQYMCICGGVLRRSCERGLAGITTRH